MTNVARLTVPSEECTMDMTDALQAVRAWPLEDRVEFAHRVWDEIVDAGWRPVLTDEQKAEIDRRLAAYQANPTDVFTWDEVEAYLRRPR